MFTNYEEDIIKVQPKTIKSKSNGCSTAPCNLVSKIFHLLFCKDDILPSIPSLVKFSCSNIYSDKKEICTLV